MRKTIIGLMLIALMAGCSNGNNHVFINNTGDEIRLSVLWSGDAEHHTITIEANGRVSSSESLAPIEAYVIADGQESMRDNAYGLMTSGFLTTIEEIEPKSWTVKVALPSSQLSGSERVYLAEKSNLMERYVSPDKLSTVAISSGNTVFDVDIYKETPPEFILLDADGNEASELNGFPVSLRAENRVLYIE